MCECAGLSPAFHWEDLSLSQSKLAQRPPQPPALVPAVPHLIFFTLLWAVLRDLPEGPGTQVCDSCMDAEGQWGLTQPQSPGADGTAPSSSDGAVPLGSYFEPQLCLS